MCTCVGVYKAHQVTESGKVSQRHIKLTALCGSIWNDAQLQKLLFQNGSLVTNLNQYPFI